MKKTAVAVLGILLMVSVAAGAGGYYGFWKTVTLANIQGQVNPVQIDVGTVEIELGKLNPGEDFEINESVRVDLSSNVNDINGRIYTSDYPWNSLNEFIISGQMIDRDSNVTVITFEQDLRQDTIEITNVPRNVTFSIDNIKGQAAYPEEPISLDNMELVIYLYSENDYDYGKG